MNTCTYPNQMKTGGWACKKRRPRSRIIELVVLSDVCTTTVPLFPGTCSLSGHSFPQCSTLLHHSIHCLPTNLPPRPVTPPVRARWATPYLLAVSIPVAGPPNTGQDSYHWSGQTVLKILWHWRNRLEQLNSIPMSLHPKDPPPDHESWKWATTNEDYSCRHNWSPIC